jgi:hypothetical protein
MSRTRCLRSRTRPFLRGARSRERSLTSAAHRRCAREQASQVRGARARHAGPSGAAPPSLARRGPARETRDHPSLAPRGLQAPLALEVEAEEPDVRTPRGDDPADPPDGRGKPPLGGRAHSWGAPEAGHPGREANSPAVHEGASTAPSRRADLGNLSRQPRPPGLGVRLPPDLRSMVPTHLRVLHHRPRLAQGRSRGSHSRAEQRLGGAADAQRNPVRHGPRFIIRDRDDKFGRDFDRVAEGVGARVLKTPVRAPRVNAVCERFLGSVRREASTTFSFSMSGTCARCSSNTVATSTSPVLIKASVSSCRSERRRPPEETGRSSRSRF